MHRASKEHKLKGFWRSMVSTMARCNQQCLFEIVCQPSAESLESVSVSIPAQYFMSIKDGVNAWMVSYAWVLAATKVVPRPCIIISIPFLNFTKARNYCDPPGWASWNMYFRLLYECEFNQTICIKREAADLMWNKTRDIVPDNRQIFSREAYAELKRGCTILSVKVCHGLL